MSQGKRYGTEEKKEILQYRQTHTYLETSQKYGISEMTLARWSRKLRDKDSREEHITGEQKYIPLIHGIKYLEGVKAAAIVNDEGIALASYLIGGESEDALRLISVALLAAADHASDELETGNIETILIKCVEGLILIQGAGPKLCIAIVFNEKMDITTIASQAFPILNRICQDAKKLSN